MATIKRCKFKTAGSEITASLNVNAKGVFSIQRPGTLADWPNGLTISGPTAEAVEDAWRAAVIEYIERRITKTKMIAVKFDSKLLPEGRKDFFERDQMFSLEAEIVEKSEVTTASGTKVKYSSHPDVSQDHPFPWWARLDEYKVQRENVVIIPWNQQTQDSLSSIFASLESTVEKVGNIFSSEKSLTSALSGGFNLLGDGS